MQLQGTKIKGLRAIVPCTGEAFLQDEMREYIIGGINEADRGVRMFNNGTAYPRSKTSTMDIHATRLFIIVTFELLTKFDTEKRKTDK